MDGLVFLSANELASAIAERRVSSSDVVEAHLERIKVCNTALNAIVTLDVEFARERAKQADKALSQGESWGPLHGLPITIKDAFETEGLRTTGGFAPWANYVPKSDAVAVARLRKAGAIILGKTNLPALSQGVQTDNAIFGRTNNPWDLERTPGGSTGGGAAAVAAGLSPLELGCDMCSSIRGPASHCGIYGLKPTSGRISTDGYKGSARPLALSKEMMGLLQLACAGPLARSVPDLRLALSVLSEPDTPTLGAIQHKDVSELRIAWTDEMGELPISQDVRDALRALAERLKVAGARVNRIESPNLDYDDAWELSGEALAALATPMQGPATYALYRGGGWLLSLFKPKHPLMRGLALGATAGPVRMTDILARREALIERVERFFESWDVWIGPAFPCPSFTHRSANARLEIDGEQVPQIFAAAMSNGIFNMSGHPVVVVPIGYSREGLPIGAQLVGRRWGEMALLDTAETIDAVAAAYRRPNEL